MKIKVSFILNNMGVEIETSPMRRLIDVLREDLGLKGVKEGCGEGECGACSALIDGELVNTCMYPVMRAMGKSVLTIEGLQKSPRYEILRGSFEEAGAVQCGFCTPGMIMAAEALLRKLPQPTEEEIRAGISGNLCRCTGYGSIVDAVRIASRRGDGLW